MDAVYVVGIDSPAVRVVLEECAGCIEANGSCTRPLYGVALIGEDSIGLGTIADGDSLEGVGTGGERWIIHAFEFLQSVPGHHKHPRAGKPNRIGLVADKI